MKTTNEYIGPETYSERVCKKYIRIIINKRECTTSIF